MRTSEPAPDVLAAFGSPYTVRLRPGFSRINATLPVLKISAIRSAPSGWVCSQARSASTTGRKSSRERLRLPTTRSAPWLPPIAAIDAARRANRLSPIGHTWPAPGSATGSGSPSGWISNVPNPVSTVRASDGARCMRLRATSSQNARLPIAAASDCGARSADHAGRARCSSVVTRARIARYDPRRRDEVGRLLGLDQHLQRARLAEALQRSGDRAEREHAADQRLGADAARADELDRV